MKVDKELIEAFDLAHGIIQPIRACVMELNLNCLPGSLELVAKCAHNRDDNAIIGYFAATDYFANVSKAENKINSTNGSIGFSIINVNDYDDAKDAEINKVRAMVRALRINTPISRGMVHTSRIVMSNTAKPDGTYTAYLFNLTLRDQFEKFVHRCNRYYKLNEKTNSQKKKSTRIVIKVQQG